MEKITYTFFEKQISPDRLREFQATRNRNIDWEGDIQALKLYIVWEKLKNQYDKLCGLNGSTNDQVNLDNIPSEIVNICEHSEIGDDIIESLEIETTSHGKINDEITIHSSAESTSQDSKISDANTFTQLNKECKSVNEVMKDVIKWPELQPVKCRKYKTSLLPCVVTSDKWQEMKRAQEEGRRKPVGMRGRKRKSEETDIQVQRKKLKNSKKKVRYSSSEFESSDDEIHRG